VENSCLIFVSGRRSTECGEHGHDDDYRRDLGVTKRKQWQIMNVTERFAIVPVYHDSELGVANFLLNHEEKDVDNTF
jgi:hypothetical protein